MRKVEATMNSMIRNGIAWSDGNTCTTYDQKGNCLVYLHGNHIATVGDSFMAIFNGGYQSNTTKSRLTHYYKSLDHTQKCSLKTFNGS